MEELPAEARRALEAIVMVSGDPVPPQMLAQLLEVSVERVEAACEALAAEYEAQGRGYVLQRVAGGYRFQSHPDAAPYVERYVLEGQSARLSNAALETLAIVAYKQPLSRAQVASIRGVNVDGVMRTLAHRGLVAEVARDPGPGQAVLYGTTPLFLERLGLDTLDDLPAIASFVPGADVVEALEHSLRVDPDPAPADTDEGEGDEGDEDDEGTSGPPDGAPGPGGDGALPLGTSGPAVAAVPLGPAADDRDAADFDDLAAAPAPDADADANGDDDADSDDDADAESEEPAEVEGSDDEDSDDEAVDLTALGDVQSWEAEPDDDRGP